jgi:hypothetical protein
MGASPTLFCIKYYKLLNAFSSKITTTKKKNNIIFGGKHHCGYKKIVEICFCNKEQKPIWIFKPTQKKLLWLKCI